MLEWTIGKIRLSVSVPFFASLLVLMLADSGSIPLWCVAASLMHEAGHVVAVLLLGNQPVRVELGVFGMRMMQQDTTALGYKRQIAVLLAGPAVNLLCAGVLFAAGQPGMIMGVHLIIGLFNLLPIEPLDGGQALLCLLALRGEIGKAEKAVFALSLVLLFLLLVCGFTLLLAGGYNFTLLAVSLYLCLLIAFKHKRS